MNSIRKNDPSFSRVLILCVAVAMARPALCETGTRENAQVLLDKARQAEYERKMAAKQTEMDRLNEDLKKGNEQAEGLQKMVESVGTALVEANGRLDRVTGQRNHQPKVMEVISLKYEAEKLRVEGLKLLEGAQSKAMAAQARHNEVTDLRTTLGALEMKIYAEKVLSKSDDVPTPEHGPKKSQGPQPGAEMRKNLAAAERNASSAETTAREAMQAATQKLQQADAAAEKAEKRRMELGVEDVSGLPVDKLGADSERQEPPKKARVKR